MVVATDPSAFSITLRGLNDNVGFEVAFARSTGPGMNEKFPENLRVLTNVSVTLALVPRAIVTLGGYRESYDGPGTP